MKYWIIVDALDTARAHYLLMLHHDNRGGRYVCGPRDSVKNMGRFTGKLIEYPGLQDVEKKVSANRHWPVDIHIQVGDATKLQKQTGRQPQVPTEHTPADLCQYWVREPGTHGNTR